MSDFGQVSPTNCSKLETPSYSKLNCQLPDSLKKINKYNSLFGEIMKNHNKTPDVIEPGPFTGGDICILDVIDIPLPNNEKNDKFKNTRKRQMKSHKEEASKSKRSCNETEKSMSHKSKRSVLPLPKLPVSKEAIEIEQKNKESSMKLPTISLSRTKNRYGSTWGERSVKSFKMIVEVGEGTYGHVFKAIDRRSGLIKALKKIRLENEREGFPITTVREIKILQQLSHKNIVKLDEVVTDYDLKSGMNVDKGFYLVFEYMDHDLYGILDSGITISDLQVASIVKQILDGLCYCHKRMFLHRDIKCSNILINNKGEVKIADFGLARRFYADNIKRPYTNKVITLWYRAPELLLGEETYGVAVDVWSIGCIMGELFTRRTMFTATNEFDQLESISKVCGIPNVGVWPDVTRLPLYKNFRPKYNYKRRLREYYCTLPNSALEVLDWMLQLDPKRRCSAEQALNSYWLRKIDPKQIPPPKFPDDKDYHELSCKRRHKQNQSDTGYKSSKSSIKPPQSGSSTNSGTQSVNIEPGSNGIVSGHVKNGSPNQKLSFELPDNVMTLLRNKLENILPNFGNIDEIINNPSLSESSIKEKLEQILEPYIKELITSDFINTKNSDFLYKPDELDGLNIDSENRSQSDYYSNKPCQTTTSGQNQSRNICKYE